MKNAGNNFKNLFLCSENEIKIRKCLDKMKEKVYKAFMYTKGIHKEGEDLEMNTLVIVLIAAVLLTAAYVFYGRWLSKKWGIDPKAETPAHKFEDGQDYVPTDGWTVFSHQFLLLREQDL